METRKLTEHLAMGTKIRRGGYLDGERVDAGHPYETAWMALAFYEREQDTRAVVHRYIMEQITDHKPSRDLHFYYNKWGMQRASGAVRRTSNGRASCRERGEQDVEDLVCDVA